MAPRKLLAIACAMSMSSSPAMAEIVLGDRVYPEHMRSELVAACQGLDMKSRESLISEWKVDEESSDPASDYYLSHVTFTLRDCKAAGLL